MGTPRSAAALGGSCVFGKGVEMPGTELVLDRKYSLDPVADEKNTAAYWAQIYVGNVTRGWDASSAFSQYKRALEWAGKWA